MSFREKSAWISFISILLVFGFYFTAVAGAMTGSYDYGRVFSLFIVSIVVLVVLEVVLHIAFAVQSPRDAAAPKDERELAIELRSTRMAFYVLMVGALGAIYTMHAGADQRAMGNSVLLAIVIAELVKFGAEIVYFRRGA